MGKDCRRSKNHTCEKVANSYISLFVVTQSVARTVSQKPVINHVVMEAGGENLDVGNKALEPLRKENIK